MPRLIISMIILSLAIGACASSAESGTTSTADPMTPSTTESSPDPTEPPDEVTTTSQPEATGTTSNRPLAPDFTLELGDGGTYTLSEGASPVYLVFWAEW
ncbi:MAG: hypothetical protein ACLFRT_02675 [Actinomycetota bacterium]